MHVNRINLLDRPCDATFLESIEEEDVHTAE
jgi:hypothetical protein